MNADATLHRAVSPLLSNPGQMMVLLDGVSMPGLRVTQLTQRGPLDRRSAMVCVDPATWRTDQYRMAHGRWDVVAMMRRADQRRVSNPLVTGRWRAGEQTFRVQYEDVQLLIEDRWQVLLDHSQPRIWRDGGQGLETAVDVAGAFEVGLNANRSLTRYAIAGTMVHVLRDRGECWTLGQALASLSAFADLKLSVGCLPGDLADQPLFGRIDLSRSAGEILAQLCDRYQLVVQRHVSLTGDQIREHRVVRPAERGRVVFLPENDDEHVAGQVLSTNAMPDRRAATAHVVHHDGYLVESTFELQPAWAPSLEGQPDATYSQSSSEFPAYVNVFRYWVLNEDGKFSAEPYHLPIYDLTTLFDQGPIPARALRLHPCLTLDEAGNRRPVLVDMSLDSGQNWQRYTESHRILGDRAGVYLEGETLASSFLAAAKSGSARIRVTATLASPKDITITRWRGNPFAGLTDQRDYHLGDALAFRRIDPASIHYAEVRAGNLNALTGNQLLVLARLADRLRQRDLRPPNGAGQAAVTLSGAWTHLRIGDRLSTAQNMPTSAQDHWVVTHTATTWSQTRGPQTQITLSIS